MFLKFADGIGRSLCDKSEAHPPAVTGEKRGSCGAKHHVRVSTDRILDEDAGMN